MCIYKTDDGKCKKFSDDKITSYCVNAPCEYEKLSNYDKIKAFSVEEMAEILRDIYTQGYIDCLHDEKNVSVKEIEQWLLQEVKK